LRTIETDGDENLMTVGEPIVLRAASISLRGTEVRDGAVTPRDRLLKDETEP
jgi:hypothetical protein